MACTTGQPEIILLDVLTDPTDNRRHNWLRTSAAGTVGYDNTMTMSDRPVRGYRVPAGVGVADRGPEVKASGRSTYGSLTAIEVTVTEGPPRHTHTREDESFYVFTGLLDVECGDDRFEAGPGSFVFLPRNLPHAFRSVGGPATALLIVTPGGLDSYFAELHAAIRSNADPAEVRRIQDAYGIVRS